MNMPIPRFQTKDGVQYDISLKCTKCGWAIVKDKVTRRWDKCRLCGSLLKTMRVIYSTNDDVTLD